MRENKADWLTFHPVRGRENARLEFLPVAYVFAGLGDLGASR
jgi:hypothetical protein